jgi:uncharacterized cofD-like protein
MQRAKNIVTIGGGTGSFTLLSGLKKYPAHEIDITAIVTMADNGGSTGRLRDEFGFLPVGDVRMALAALSDTDDRELLRELFLYRFNKGAGLSGHNFGNLFLVALTDVLGSEEKAIEYAGKILRIRGRVLPVTGDNTNLVAKYSDGTITKGESAIDEPTFDYVSEKQIEKVFLEPKVSTTENVRKAIVHADIIVLGPGDLYTSTIPNLLAEGVSESLQKTSAKIVYVVNLMTKFGQTSGYSAQTFVDKIAEYIGRVPDFVVINNTPLPQEVFPLYEAEYEFPVEDDLKDNGSFTIIRDNLLSQAVIKKSSSDKLKRSLIRHDPDALGRVVLRLLNNSK